MFSKSLRQQSILHGRSNLLVSRKTNRTRCQLITTSSTSTAEILQSCKDYTMWSWSAQKAVDPMVMTNAEGIYVYDNDGKRYVDFNSQLMCSNIGHKHPKVIQVPCKFLSTTRLFFLEMRKTLHDQSHLMLVSLY